MKRIWANDKKALPQTSPTVCACVCVCVCLCERKFSSLYLDSITE